MIGTPQSTSAILTTKLGTPSINSFVPSNGSTTQTFSFDNLDWRI